MSTKTNISVEFKKERITQFRRIMNLTIVEIESRMSIQLGRKISNLIGRWLTEDHGPRDMETVESLANALEIPLDFFYYRYSISMDNWVYVLHCYETNKTITIKSKATSQP